MLIVVTLIKVSHSREKGQSGAELFCIDPYTVSCLEITHFSAHEKFKVTMHTGTQEQQPRWALAGGIKWVFFRVIAMPVDGVLK